MTLFLSIIPLADTSVRVTLLYLRYQCVGRLAVTAESQSTEFLPLLKLADIFDSATNFSFDHVDMFGQLCLPEEAFVTEAESEEHVNTQR